MKIVIVTGSSRGLGASTALECARRGMGVIVTYNSSPEKASEVTEAIAAIGGKAAVLQLDVGDSQSFPDFCKAVSTQLEAVWQRETFDALVNNAGYGLYAPIADVTEEQFDGLFNVHLKGPFFLTQALLPLMEAGGHVINVTSATSRVATAGVAPYAAFKGGLEVLTRYMAKEFGARGIRANSVAPGAIRTELGGGLSKGSRRYLRIRLHSAGLVSQKRLAVSSPVCCQTRTAGSMLRTSKWLAGTLSE